MISFSFHTMRSQAATDAAEQSQLIATIAQDIDAQISRFKY
ncbi:hypothetical protein Q3O60_10025 [Alkalimonas collagenimarina]|uniref:Methyl-accepting chemotaxis protein n=1 Tax=Alkalimonas collagenimarina TaxID=400390 RepID=A0ABT9GZN0_9GAMM|nr:hypothetical protein [Alkalimonas collagenimarina]MDP4536525.1 hypothetical protein [Alkalimonas collagenimarina]